MYYQYPYPEFWTDCSVCASYITLLPHTSVGDMLFQYYEAILQEHMPRLYKGLTTHKKIKYGVSLIHKSTVPVPGFLLEGYRDKWTMNCDFQKFNRTTAGVHSLFIHELHVTFPL